MLANAARVLEAVATDSKLLTTAAGKDELRHGRKTVNKQLLEGITKENRGHGTLQ